MKDPLARLRAEAKGCRACPLWENATHTVIGEGDSHATVMLVGEQPGDEEDRTGKPFVGPAGRPLDRALVAAGIDRDLRLQRRQALQVAAARQAPAAQDARAARDRRLPAVA